MAIYHLHTKIISRSKGKSSVGASAYRSGEKLCNKREGLVHDYTRKKGVVFKEILAPNNAPNWATNRERLWNEVEKIEKSKNSQLAREIDVALPIELDLDKQIDLFCFCEEDWDSFKKSREYLSGRRDNKPSYFWDKLVQDSAICALNDTTQIIYQSNPCDKDIALRYMAMEDRLSRRMFSKAMLTSISRCEPDQIRTTAFLSKITPNLMYIFLLTNLFH